MSGSDELPEEVQTQIAQASGPLRDAMFEINNNSESIREFFRSSFRAHTEGEDIQNRVDSFFSTHSYLPKVLLLIHFTSTSPENVADIIQNEEEVPDHVVAEFIDVCRELDWIEQPVRAFYRKKRYDAEWWTTGSLNFERRYGKETVATQSYEWGVDEVCSMTVPIDSFIDDSINQLEGFVEWLDDLDDDDKIHLHEGSKENVVDVEERLLQVAEDLSELPNRVETVGDDE